MKKITVWIIEDGEEYREDAKQIVSQIVRKEKKLPLDIWSGSDLEWGDGNWPSISKDGEHGSPKLPDLVILDLFNEEDELRGDSIYKILRRREVEEKRHSNAFVIVWSGYRGDSDAEKFVEEAESDNRFFALETKDEMLLEDRVRLIMERLEGEG